MHIGRFVRTLKTIPIQQYPPDSLRRVCTQLLNILYELAVVPCQYVQHVTRLSVHASIMHTGSASAENLLIWFPRRLHRSRLHSARTATVRTYYNNITLQPFILRSNSI